MAQTQFQTQIRVLRSDDGKEFFNSVLGDSFSSKKGIGHQSSHNINTPQQNGVAERKNKYLLEVVRGLSFTIN